MAIKGLGVQKVSNVCGDSFCIRRDQRKFLKTSRLLCLALMMLENFSLPNMECSAPKVEVLKVLVTLGGIRGKLNIYTYTVFLSKIFAKKPSSRRLVGSYEKNVTLASLHHQRCL